MPLKSNQVPSNGNANRPDPLEPGTYPARVVQVVDLGLQKQRPYEGQEKDPAYEIRVTYELLDEFMLDEDGNEDHTKPRWIGEDFKILPLHSERAKSTARYLAIDPSRKYDGEWDMVLGWPVMVKIVQKPNKKDPSIVYNNVDGLSSMRPKEAEKAPELVNPPKLFDLGNPDLEIFGSLPNFVQEKVKENLEFEGSPLQALLESSGTSGPKEGKKATREAVSESQGTSNDEDW